MARPRRSEENRQRLIAQGVELLSVQGYHGTGIQQVLDAVNVPKGSFYNYFKSKEDFAAEVIRSYTDADLAPLEELLKTPGIDGLTALKRFFEAFIAAAEADGYRKGCLLGNMAAEASEVGEIVAAALRASVQRVHDRLTKCLQQAQTEGTIRQDIPADTLADLLLDTFEGSLLHMKVAKSVAPVREALRLSLDVLLKPQS